MTIFFGFAAGFAGNVQEQIVVHGFDYKSSFRGSSKWGVKETCGVM